MVNVVENVNIANPVSGIPVAASAYVLYESNGAMCAATKHRIKDNKLGLGRTISLSRLKSEFSESASESEAELLPSNTLVYSENRMLWHTPAVRKPMWFLMQGKSNGFEVWWPNLLWDVDRVRKRLSVFALGRSTRPCPESIVYHAPLMNIDSAGVLCEGTARLPRELNLSSIDRIQACIFESSFTHVNHNATLRSGASDIEHMQYWRKQSRSMSRVSVKDMSSFGRLRELLS